VSVWYLYVPNSAALDGEKILYIDWLCKGLAKKADQKMSLLGRR